MPQFLHPIGHHVFGQRLHYLQINVGLNAGTVAGTIEELLDETGLTSSSCAYLIFGECDILIRIWATDHELASFRIKLIGRFDDIQIRTLLITKQDTWYQRKIESKNKNWGDNFAPENLELFLSNEAIPDSLEVNLPHKNKKRPTKFFIVIEEPFGRKSDVFGILYSELHSRKKEGFFSGIDQVSIYSFLTDRIRGVIVKGESNDFNEVSEKLIRLVQNLKEKSFAAKTTTYFCAKSICNENTYLNKHTIKAAGNRRHILVYNLLRSHDVHDGIWERDHETRDRNHAFLGLLAKHYHLMFVQLENTNWWHSIAELAKIYRWVIRKSDSVFKGYLINQYIDLEKYFRDVFEPHPHIWDRKRKNKLDYDKMALKLGIQPETLQKELSIGRESETNIPEFSMGNVIDCLNFCKRCIANTHQNAKLSAFIKLLRPGNRQKGIISNRNDLAHGNIRQIFDSDETLWTNFVENSALLILLFPEIRLLIHKALLNDVEMENSRKKYPC